ncbi:right-handed parallel beta-helix repeat-containing protein [Spirosoma rhododendri]|uniref:right-handed parallel beta-helix repeat-containing protein n=1 Tax=Spirosoma rhododendri TaxID=2728024 RepID=UPI0020C4CA0C|nr:right-handed parallel beta-helix repeat-containing protein [Spirosoma rhododendri]
MLTVTVQNYPRPTRRIGRGMSALLLSLLVVPAAFSQTTYYVAANGSDGNSGRSVDSPFQSLAKASSLSLQPGDQVLLRRGDTFRGTLYVRQSGASGNPIVVDAYGSGNKPVIAGSTLITGWNNVGNNTWQASCPSCGSRVTGVYRDNTVLPLGRYPNLSDSNKGYLTIQSHNGRGQITSQQGLPTSYAGGEAVIRSATWVLDRVTIAQQNGNTLSLAGSTTYEPTDGWGYFIQNHPATLDQVGEWYYNPSDKTIRLFDNQNNPNNQSIALTTAGEGINLTNVNNVTVRNVKVTQTLSSGVLSVNGNGIALSGNDITNSGENAVFFNGSGSGITVENNLLEDANNSGLTIQSFQNFTFRGNTVQRIGLVPGRGVNGDGSYSGLQSSCPANSLIEYNVFDNIGYTGVSVVTSSTVQYNRVSNYCMTKSDGGGLYTWNGNRNNVTGLRFLSNIIYNGVGAPEGAPINATTGAHGIFLDDCTVNAEVTGNSIFRVAGMGIFLRGAYNNTLKNNTVFDNGEEQLKIVANQVCTPRNITSQNNIFVSKLATQTVAGYESSANDLSQYGSFDYNYYMRPFEDQFKILAVYNPGSGLTGQQMSLAEWQNKYGQDRNSGNSPITYKSQMVTQTGATLLNFPYGGDINGWGVWSPYGNGRADWNNPGTLDGGRCACRLHRRRGRATVICWRRSIWAAYEKGKPTSWYWTASRRGPTSALPCTRVSRLAATAIWPTAPPSCWAQAGRRWKLRLPPTPMSRTRFWWCRPTKTGKQPGSTT